MLKVLGLKKAPVCHIKSIINFLFEILYSANVNFALENLYIISNDPSIQIIFFFHSKIIIKAQVSSKKCKVFYQIEILFTVYWKTIVMNIKACLKICESY